MKSSVFYSNLLRNFRKNTSSPDGGHISSPAPPIAPLYLDYQLTYYLPYSECIIVVMENSKVPIEEIISNLDSKDITVHDSAVQKVCVCHVISFMY